MHNLGALRYRGCRALGAGGGVTAAVARQAGPIAILLASAFIVAVQARIVTYVCGNDPMLYIRAARVLLHPDLYGSDALVQALTFVAPGYTLLLALTIRVFGDLAPYWLNLVLLLASLPFSWSVLRRLMGSNRAAAFALLWGWAILLGGHELSAAYLLHPFREAPVLLCAYAAYAALLRAVRPGAHGLWAAGAALALITACAFREPSVFLVPGALAGLLLLAPTWRARRRVGAWFLLPWVLLGLAAWMALRVLGYTGSSQFEATRYLRHTEVALVRMREMLGWIPAEAGWGGVVCMALGVARAARRSPVLLVWFLAPALLLFVFYAHMQMHARYFLAAFLYAVVFAGYGLDGLLRLLERWLGGGIGKALRTARGPAAAAQPARALVRGLPILTTAVCTLALSALMVRVVLNAHPWGPVVKADEVRQWQSLVAELAPSADGRVRIALEQRCRYLEDLLLSYTDADLLDPKQVEGWPPRWAPAHYFQPLNGPAFYATPQWLMYLTLHAHRLLGDRMDLIPAGAGPPVIRTLGRGRYLQHVLNPWTAGSHKQRFALQPRRDQVLWLDWGTAPVGAVRTVTVGNAQSGHDWVSCDMAGAGLQAIFLPGGVIDGGDGVLTVVSSTPAPERPLVGVVEAGHPQSFDLGDDRRLSLNRLMSGLDEGSREEYPLSLEVGSPRAFRAPALHSGQGGTWRVHLGGGVGTSPPLYLRCRRQDGREVVLDVTAAGGECSFESGAGETVMLSLECAPPPMRVRWLVRRIAVEYRPEQTRVR